MTTHVPTIDDTIAFALQYLAEGYQPVQLHGLRSLDGAWVCTCQKAEKCGNSTAKHPVDNGWETTHYATAIDLEVDFRRRPWAHNLGIITGADSGVWVLDIDPDKGGIENAKRMLDNQEEIPKTRTVRTGSGGFHYYFTYPDDRTVGNRTDLAKFKGVDVRGTGGQVVVPPSVSAKGPYQFVSESAAAPAPGWLLDLAAKDEPATPDLVTPAPSEPLNLEPIEAARLQHYAGKVVTAELLRLRALTEKGWEGEAWDATTYHVACALIEIANSPWSGYTVEGLYTAFIETAPRDPGFDDERVNAKWLSAASKVGSNARPMPPKPVRQDDFFDSPDVRTSPSTSGPIPQADPDGFDSSVSPTPVEYPIRSWDDLGNAKRMVDRYSGRLRWVEQAEAWAVYADGKWEMSGPRLAQSLAQHMIDNLVDDEADKYSDVEIHNPGGKPEVTIREAFVKWAKAQRMSARIQACLTETRAAPALQAKLADFDRDPELLNCANGVVHLRTGELLAHAPELLLMQRSDVSYAPGAAAPRWQTFLDRVMPDPADQLYLQAIVGYSLTGKTAEQAMFLHHGSGANGKSVFLQVMTTIAGDYGQVVPRSTLLVSQSEQHPEAVARMVGKRFLQTSETAAGRRLDEEIVKGLTGGEMQTARFMHQGSFDFRPTGKIHYVTNHLPRLTDAESIWRRIHLIAWSQTIPEAERDGDLADKIIANESEGVLAWAVAGAQSWLENGLQVPESAKTGLKEYRTSQDVFGDFLAERTMPHEGAKTPSSTLYDAYSAWCFKSGIKKPMTAQAFGATLTERGFESYRTAKGRGFQGISVVSLITEEDLMGLTSG